jgi:lysophospholipase L1-like esterase
MSLLRSGPSLQRFFSILASQGVRKKTTSQQGIENPKALAPFFKSLGAAKSGSRVEPVRIMHFGDSHVAADVLTARIREHFQAEFGNGGHGFIVPRNPMSTRRRGVLSGATEGWVIEGIGGRTEADRIYGPAGITLATTAPGERAWLEAFADHFEVYFVREPGVGKVNITVDGVNALEEPVLLNAREPKVDYISIDVPPGLHHVEVRTLSAGKVRLLGIVGENISPGVSYDVFGINGARANRLLGWNQSAFAEALQARNPDLIILSYGTNEVADGDWTSISYELLLGNILRRLHTAVPNASILVWAPPDRADLPLFGRTEALVSAERAAALDNNAAFWSAYSAMGGAGSMKDWVQRGLAQPDRVHLTAAGYARLAEMFYEDLKRASERSPGPSVLTKERSREGEK